jgi:hypothetical protein
MAATPTVVGDVVSYDFGSAVVNAFDNVDDVEDRILIEITVEKWPCKVVNNQSFDE